MWSKERKAAYQRDYYDKNKERINARTKAYKEKQKGITYLTPSGVVTE